MHYFIFPDIDTTLYQASSSKNTGLDEILEVQKINFFGKYSKLKLFFSIYLIEPEYFINL